MTLTVDRIRRMLGWDRTAGIGGTGAPVRGGPLAYKRTKAYALRRLVCDGPSQHSSARRLAESGESQNGLTAHRLRAPLGRDAISFLESDRTYDRETL